jgi:hypothetical protein
LHSPKDSLENVVVEANNRVAWLGRKTHLGFLLDILVECNSRFVVVVVPSLSLVLLLEAIVSAQTTIRRSNSVVKYNIIIESQHRLPARIMVA